MSLRKKGLADSLAFLFIKFQSLFNWMSLRKRTGTSHEGHCQLVSILVQLDVLAEDIVANIKPHQDRGFNPCSIGCPCGRTPSSLLLPPDNAFQSLFNWMSLRKTNEKEASQNRCIVSILVQLDVLAEVVFKGKSELYDRGFNPCSIGCPCGSRTTAFYEPQLCYVSILVQLDVLAEVHVTISPNIPGVVSILVQLDVLAEDSITKLSSR